MDDMSLVSKEKALDTESRRHRARDHAVRFDLFEGPDKAGEGSLGLLDAPSVARVAKDRVDAAS
jgi:hypothetical protein